MSIYWIMFILPFLGYIRKVHVSWDLRHITNVFFIIIFSLLIGLRYEVGGDWDSYMYLYSYYDLHNLKEFSFLHNDYLYFVLNAVANSMGLGIWVPNLVCAIVLVFGAVVFCNQQKNYYLALLICIPYLFIVVGMGYSRQAAAIGLVFLALAMLNNRRIILFLFFIFMGSLFHKSCLIVAPFGILSIRTKGSAIIFVGSIFLALIGITFDAISTAVNSYIGGRASESSGAYVRIILSSIPALLILRYRKVLLAGVYSERFWLFFSFIPLIALPLVSVASNLTDRLLLYSIPLQVFCFSRLDLLFNDYLNKQLINLLVIALYFLVMFVWLNYGAHSQYWLPYKSFITGP